MNNKVRRLLNPSEVFCADCTDEIRAEMLCEHCKKTLFESPDKVYECPLCEKFYCTDCWTKMERTERFKGKITSWFEDRNYGFIHSRKFKKDVFAHGDDLDFEPHKGKKVSFELENTTKGPRARRIRDE